MASNNRTSNIVQPITTNYRFEDSNGHTRYCWTPSQQGLLKSALFIGYVILQVSGGSLSERFGTKIVLGISALSSSLLTLATPIASNLNYWAIFAIRFLIGLSLSVTYPAIPPLIQKWVPEQEKSMWLSCVIVGGNFPVTQILREISFCPGSLKNAIFCNFGDSEFWFLVNFRLQIVQKCIKSEFRAYKIGKMADFALLEYQNLISWKIWVIAKLWIFHTGSFGTVVAFPLCGFILDQLDWEVCTQCGNFRNFLSVIFYVKSKYGIIGGQKLPF